MKSINRTISTYIQKQGSNGEYVIRTSSRWKDDNQMRQCVVLNVGFTVLPDKWDSENSRVKKRAVNKKGISALEINREIQQLEAVFDETFKKFELQNLIPSRKEVKDSINYSLGRSVSKPRELNSVQDAFSAYMIEVSNTKTLSLSTYAKLKTVKTVLKEFDENLKLEELTKEKLDEYVSYLLSERELQNTTIKKNLTFVKTFLKYCEERRLIHTDWKTHSIELKVVNGKSIVFLDLNEFEKVYNLKFPENKQYLERTRDVFCFQCLTALRYSDVSKLKKQDISPDSISVVTEKTDTVLHIPLNEKAKSILKKYADLEVEKALPVISNQKMNEYIKEVCYLAEINQPIAKSFFKGKIKHTETFPKHELIGTHTARRTFICIALASGVTPQTVMRITGHTDYKSMQPYIDVTDKSKIDAVNIFN